MLTREKIITAAFEVWGNECYRTRSLRLVVDALGVSKAALYRHFKDKDTLIVALYETFYSRFIPFLQGVYRRLLEFRSHTERYLFFGRELARYFIDCKTDFGFLFFMVLDNQDPRFSLEYRLRKASIEFESLFVSSEEEAKVFPYKITLIFSTVGFYSALYLLKGWYSLDKGSELFFEGIGSLLKGGLGYDPSIVSELKVKKTITGTADEGEMLLPRGDLSSTGHLIRAVAAAVAERGPWKASMSFVAERSGLSKSGLYAHFESKEAMLSALFGHLYEDFLRWVRGFLTKRGVSPEDSDGDNIWRLQCIIDALFRYLRVHRDALVILDWVRIQQLDIGTLPEKGMALWHLMGPLRPVLEALPVGPYNTHRWILFSLISVLMVQIRQPLEVPDEDILKELLFTYLACGVEGWSL